MNEIVISRQIANVIKEGELEKSNMQKKHIANSDKPVSDYSLVVGWNSAAFSGIVGYSAVLVYCLWWKTLRYSTLQTRHIRNAFNVEELIRSAVVAKNATTDRDGKSYLLNLVEAVLSKITTTEVCSVVRNEGNWQAKCILNSLSKDNKCLGEPA